MIRPIFLVVRAFGHDVQVNLIDRRTGAQQALIISQSRIDIGLINPVIIHEGFIARIPFIGADLDKDACVVLQWMSIHIV